ncbi:FG-GAP-like repeat-containing protein, partial [Limisphaera sp. 4302-co]|uniref:FG-GAP-like repeat-containing protein n=1 Tax=Limisphaera sp. 4302-co TaxID=3400417 RepID=UPI003C28C9C6
MDFIEAVPGTGWYVAAGTNTFDGTGSANADDWTFNAESGDRLSVRIEAALGAARPRLRLLDPSGQTIASVNGDTSGVAEFRNVPLPAPGGYRVRVYTDNQVSDYAVRADLSRGPTLESEPNDDTNNAVRLSAVFLAGSFQLRGIGALPAEDAAGDWFHLGTLQAGNTVSAELQLGPWSTLQTGDASMVLYRLGEINPVATLTTSTNFTVSEPGDYLARVFAPTNRGLLARYYLAVTITDAAAPTVTAAALPEEGGSTTDLIHGFTVTFSEPLRPSTATNAAAYSLRQAGPDNVFNTADDLVYPLTISYPGANTVTVSLNDGPLQWGATRFSIASTVMDRAGNPLAPAFLRQFTVQPLDPFRIENRSNDTIWTGTSLAPQGSPQPDGSFGPVGDLAVSGRPYALVAVPLDGDADLDLVVARFDADRVTLLLGDGTGGFQIGPEVPVGDGPAALAAGDLNEDGATDVVVANYYGHNVSVLLGDGTGNLVPRTNLATGNNPRSVALEDLNHDGHLDLVAGNSGSGNVTVRLGLGDGNFGQAISIPAGAGVWGMALGDLNADGHLDLVTANASVGTVGVALGRGDGTFEDPTFHAGWNNPRQVAVADLTGDGVLDVIVLASGANEVGLLAGTGDGNLVETGRFGSGGTDGYDLLLGDVNGDGREDVLVAGYGNQRVAVLLNNGAGGLEGAATYVTGSGPVGLALGDWNGDGRIGWVSANSRDNTISVWDGLGTEALAEDPP